MDDVAHISSVLGLLRLLDLARDFHSHLRYIHGNGELTSRLDKRVGILIGELESFPVAVPSGEATCKLYELIRTDLEAVRNSLNSLTSRSLYGTVMKYVKATSDRKTLNKCEEKLVSIMTHVTSLKAVVTTLQRSPTIYQTATEPPKSSVGLDRAMTVSDFLTRSEAQALRVVCIHGEAGLGKTTLLNHLWNTASTKNPFLVRAFVQIGHNATEVSICRLQASIVRQLDTKNLEFPTKDFGKDELTRCFERLNVANKPLFLAIDNVFSLSDVDSLLPSELAGSKLPVKSCIALTCRDIRVAESLIGNCGFQVTNEEQVLCYKPPFLTDKEGEEVFTAYAGMQQVAPEHHELLGTLVPLCKGLPLALTILGKVFRDQRKWASKEWRDIAKEMITMEGAAGFEVRKVLQTGYDALEQPLQAVFLDMVEFFYGWPWDVVEGIVGKQLKNLEESSLISQVATLLQCNQGAMSQSTCKILDYFDLDLRGSHVWMHDLTLNFGRSILNNTRMGYIRHWNQIPSASQLANIASSLRYLVLTVNVNVTELPIQMADASSLQLLAVIQSPLGCTFAASCGGKASSSHQDEAKLRYLMLGKLNGLDNTILEAKVSPEIRGIHLIDCGGIRHLPKSFVLQELQDLTINRCPAFQGFSSRCIRGWCNLKRLCLVSIPIVRIPKELGYLPKLQLVQIKSCGRLEEFPPMTDPEKLLALELEDCPALKRMGHISCHLEKLSMYRCPELPELPDCSSFCLETCKILILYHLPQLLLLPSSICSMTALKHLELVGCETLVKLPHNIGVLPSLEVLSLLGCTELPQLPSSVCNMTTLRLLELTGSETLVELPHNIGDLPSLETLVLWYCKKLHHLSNSICSMTALKRLDLKGCAALVELPHNIGDLSSLERLLLNGCTNLRQLPSSIGKMKALKLLDLERCGNLVELPHDIGNLPSLELFQMQYCTKVLQLPSSICSMTALKLLDLTGCGALVELPQNTGDLPFLETIRLSYCRKLQKLPSSICSLKALKEFDLTNCETLVELPSDIGGLPSLNRLWLQGCTQLQHLPSSICSITALKLLDLAGCEMLAELPHNLGDLPSLEILKLWYCTKLQQLPDSICRMMALKKLNMSGCTSLVELPHNIGNLPLLTEVNLENCTKLRQLPNSICNLRVLEKLELKRCESLVKLPENIGDLPSLETLSLLGCTKLQGLPSSICSLMVLEVLSLERCETLVELPHNIGDVSSLKRLCLSYCTKLQQLPSSICSIVALKWLDLEGCENLEYLPENIGDLPSLRALDLRGCTNLRQLPSSICSIVALVLLELTKCESLVDLPDNIGDLPSLESLILRRCTKLRQLPTSMCSMMVLKVLDLTGCEALVDLPDNIGDLSCLECLRLWRCTKLQRLPNSLCRMMALKELNLTECESLVELPDNIGDLHSLEMLFLRGCTKLRSLPCSIRSMRALKKLEEP